MIERFISLPDTAPAWLQQAWPTLLTATEILAAGFALWLVSWLVKRLVKALGRARTSRNKEVFDGSAWDLGGSLSQFFVLVIGAPGIAALAGLDVRPFLEANAVSILGAFAILAAGITISRWLSVSVRSFGERAKRRGHSDDTLFRFGASLGRYVVIILAIIFALQMVGFQPGTLIAVVGAAGLAIALALQDTLRAVAAGVLLAVFRPFKIGDYVLIDGAEGEVVDVTPFHTTLKTIDVRSVIIPNDKAWSQAITNFSAHSERRLDLYYDVSYEDDLERALAVMREAISALPKCRRADELWVAVHSMGASAITLRVRPWCARADFLDFCSDCHIAVKRAFDAAGITIPLPQQVEYSRPYAVIAPKGAPDAEPTES